MAFERLLEGAVNQMLDDRWLNQAGLRVVDFTARPF